MKICKVNYGYRANLSMKKLFKQFFPDLECDANNEVKCPVCSKVLMAKRFIRHYRTNHCSKCTICNISFETYHRKSKHMALVHNVKSHFERFQKKNECYICGQKYITPSEVRNHIRIAHEQLRSFLCDICGNAFLRKNALKSHRRRHFNIKPYECKLCPNRYTCVSALKKHLKSRHNLVVEGKWNDPFVDRESLPWRKLTESEASELLDSDPNEKTNISQVEKYTRVKENEPIVEPDFIFDIL